MSREPLLTVKQVALRLSLSESEVRGMLSDGLIPFTRVGRNGGRRRVSETDLADYLARSKAMPDSKKPLPFVAAKVAKVVRPVVEYATLRRFGLSV